MWKTASKRGKNVENEWETGERAWISGGMDMDRNRSVKCGKVYAEEKERRVFHKKGEKSGVFGVENMENHVETVENFHGKPMQP